MPTIYNLKLPRIILKQRAPKIDIVPDTICPKFNDLLLMFWQIFVCSAKSAKDNNKKTAYNYLISRKKCAAILVCLYKTLWSTYGGYLIFGVFRPHSFTNSKNPQIIWEVFCTNAWIVRDQGKSFTVVVPWR